MKFIDGVKKEYFYNAGVYTLLNPSKEQEEKLKEVIIEQGTNLVEGEAVPMPIIRFILEELSGFSAEIKELSDEKINEVLDNGDMNMTRFCDAVADMIEFYSERICIDNKRKIKEALNMIEGVSEFAEKEVKEKEAITHIVKLAKLNGITITNKEKKDKSFEEILKLIEEKSNKKGKR